MGNSQQAGAGAWAVDARTNEELGAAHLQSPELHVLVRQGEEQLAEKSLAGNLLVQQRCGEGLHTVTEQPPAHARVAPLAPPLLCLEG